MQRILIAGASRGLGLELTRIYLERGEEVWAGARDPKAPDLAALAAAHPGRLRLFPMDLRDEASLRAAAEDLRKAGGGLDLVVNNGAVNPASDKLPLEEADTASMLDTYNINVLGPLRVSKYFLGFLKGRRHAALVNISSSAASISHCSPSEGFAYPMSKAALNMQSAMLAKKMAKEGPRVIALHPGWFRSAMGGSAADLSVPEAAQAVVKVIEAERGNLGGPVYLDYLGKEMAW